MRPLTLRLALVLALAALPVTASAGEPAPGAGDGNPGATAGADPEATPEATDDPADDPISEAEAVQANQACLDCHTDPEARLVFDDGSSVTLLVDEAALAASVHRRKLLCTDCHRRSGEYPHPEVSLRSRRDYTLGQYEMCRRCHFANYARTLEGVHFKLLSTDPAHAPVCVDCHGSHDMKAARRPRAAISRRCAPCHQKVFDAYAKSVHGRALLDEHNDDVPVCTDCHRAHDILDPHKAAFANQIPALCGRCHADPKRMRKYKLSTDVLGSYLSDFHGATARLGRGPADEQRVAAVCTDCHGVHDIASTHGRDPAELRDNLRKACARCHEGAPRNFPDAWMPHYEASLSKAPLVFLVKLFYWIFIPVVALGLLLQILLHIFRIASNR